MEFAQGQVFSIGKISEQIKRTKEKKAYDKQVEQMKHLISRRKEEIDLLKSSLNLAENKEMIEPSIYRLKAAELDFNRELKLAKSINHLNGN